MEQSFGLLFYLKKRKNSQESSGTNVDVYVRITIDGKSCEISAKRKCDTGKWNTSSGRMNGKNDVAKEFNQYLDTLQQKVFEAKRKLIEIDKEVTAGSIRAILLGREINKQKYMLMEIFRNHNDQMKLLVGNEFAEGTFERYETSLKHTRSFLKWKFRSDDIELKKLDYEFISDYEFWLKSERKCGHNSTMKYLSNFKKIVNRCLRNGWLAKDPFIGFKMTKREVERTPLTENELEEIMTKKIGTERIALVRDIFLFSCFTGMAYADVKKMKRQEIIIGPDGDNWIISKRQKTDVSARIPLLNRAQMIIEKYSNHPLCQLDDRVLPVLSNQKMNAYLKEIADLCGIQKRLTYHIARHTFATTVTLSNGVPIETVAKMLGHRNLKTTQHYAKIIDRKISDDMKRIRDKFS